MKRKSKEQREAEAKASLRQRVADIACGAAGYQFDNGEEFAGAEFLSRFVPALQAVFGEETDDGKVKSSNNYLFNTLNLNHYDNIDTATDFLYEHHVRA